MAFKGVTVLDIGSSAITAIAGERGVNNTFAIKGQAVKHYEGFAEGNFFDEQDLERVIRIRGLGYEPFVMVYNKPAAPAITKRLQLWCNNKWIFKKCENFEDYVPFLKKGKQNAKNSE